MWEIDGARHREILSNAAFLRELRMEMRNVFNAKAAADKVRAVAHQLRLPWPVVKELTRV